MTWERWKSATGSSSLPHLRSSTPLFLIPLWPLTITLHWLFVLNLPTYLPTYPYQSISPEITWIRPHMYTNSLPPPRIYTYIHTQHAKHTYRERPIISLFVHFLLLLSFLYRETTVENEQEKKILCSLAFFSFFHFAFTFEDDYRWHAVTHVHV